MPTFSVIIPAYNSEQFLPETLESLRAQTYADFEVVIVNDGSTDNTQTLIDAVCASDNRFRSLTQENAGVSAARNRGLAAATGDYVTFLDADDTYTPTTLQAFSDALRQTNADLILGRLCMIENGKQTGFHEAADTLAACEHIDNFDKRLLWNFLVSNKCYRRTFLLDHHVAFPATGFSEEGAFFMDAVFAGATICGTTDSVVYYRRHTATEGRSVSQTASVKNLHSLQGSMQHIYDAANAALARAGKQDDTYLQEILYKHLHILASQFYRELWHMSDEALALCAAQMTSLLPRLTNARILDICKANPDLQLTTPYATRTQAAAHPALSVIITKACSADAAKALFRQTSPLFELILTPQAAQGVPKEILAMPNVHITDGDCAPKAKHVMRTGVLPVLEPGTLQFLYRAGLPAPGVAAKLASRLLKWRHRT